MNRRLMPALAVIVAGGLLGACAQGTSDDTTEKSSFDKDAALSGDLTISGFGGDDEVGKARLDEAEKALGSDVTVKLVAKGAFDIQQFLSSVASGEPPEIIYASRNQIGTFAARGAILPLTDCIEGEGIDTSQYREEVLAEVTVNDEVYGIPEFNVVQIIQANQKLLDQAGVSVEDVNGSDWDAVAAANKALMKAKGGKLSVIGFDSKLPEFLPLWAKANGADLISEDGRTAQLDDPAVIEALEFAVGIYDAQGGFTKVKAFRDSFTDFFGEGNQYASNALGAMPMEQWYVNVLNEATPDVPMAFDTVRSREGDPIAFASGNVWAIPKGTANPEAACRFAKVMTSTDSWVKAAEARIAARKEDGGLFTGLLTGNKEADDKIRAMVKPSGDPKWDSAIEKTYEANDNTFTMPANPAGEEFQTAWQEAVNRVLNGEQEPQEAMAQAQEEAQAALDKAWATLDEG
jgi:multiple sugar transport system substrate-binding protein